MGAAYDLLNENEYLEDKISNLRSKNREMKKDLVEFIKGLESVLDLSDREKADKLLKKYDKPKKKSSKK